jgi:hypothetical protein
VEYPLKLIVGRGEKRDPSTIIILRVSKCSTACRGIIVSELLESTADVRPQYWEIYRLKEVIGISLVFMAVDIGGGLFSFLSLFFRAKLDYAAFVSQSHHPTLIADILPTGGHPRLHCGTSRLHSQSYCKATESKRRCGNGSRSG